MLTGWKRLIVNVTNSLKHNGTSVHWHVGGNVFEMWLKLTSSIRVSVS